MNPKIGQSLIVHGVHCRIIRIHSFGTVDVLEVNGHRAWRVSGLPFI